MDALRLQNFRCIEDSGTIELKPLNFLVGSNSSGKSSFLKFFPLIKQSIGQRKKGVFLWNGNNVDFQNFSTTVRNGEKFINVGLTINNINWARRLRLQKSKIIPSITLDFCIESNGNFDSLVNLKLKYGDQFIDCHFDTERTASVSVNNLSSQTLKDKIICIDTSSLFPRFLFSNSGRIDDDNSYACFKRLKEIAEKNIGNSTPRNLFPLYSNVFVSKNELKERISHHWKIDLLDGDLEEIHSLITYYNINNILDSININMFQLAENMIYVGPLREATERYYRFQNLAVDEIEPDGSNLAMYLYNLNQSKVLELNDWIKELFGFKVKIEATEGHVQILIEEENKQLRNLVDSGFGYTQVLPILVNIWKALYMDTNIVDSSKMIKDEHIIAIEQPELHLHPRFQALFAEMLVKVINRSKADGKDIRFIIETHSEMILNKIGESIALGRFDRNDVHVILFNAQKENMKNYIEKADFSSDGFLNNWPIGFFAEDVD